MYMYLIISLLEHIAGFPLSGKSGNIGEFCFDWNVGGIVREFCCLSGNFVFGPSSMMTFLRVFAMTEYKETVTYLNTAVVRTEYV